MANVRFDVPDPFHEAVKEKAEKFDKTHADIYREYIEEGLENDGLLDHIETELKESLKETRPE